MYRDDSILRFYSAQSFSHNNLVSKLFDGPAIRTDKTGTYFHRTMKGITVGQEHYHQQGRQRVEGPWPEGDGKTVWDGGSGKRQLSPS